MDCPPRTDDPSPNHHVFPFPPFPPFPSLPGYWTPETHHLSGAYDWHDYSECDDHSHGAGGLPVWLPASGYIAVDQGGDSGTGEIALMVLDFLVATNDTQRFLRYYPVAAAVADYFSQHYAGRFEGRAVVWPSQVLEAIWCWYDSGAKNFSANCCQDDTPTVSGMITVFEKLAQLAALPGSPVTPEQRGRWAAFSAIMPQIAVNATTNTMRFARVEAGGAYIPSIGEGAELYPMHPHRVFTRGRQVASGQDLSLALSTFEKSLWTNPETNSLWNTGWAYVVNAAALLGLTGKAAIGVLDRARTGPAAGFRFPGFAPAMQDAGPSADHFANMARALQEMLLQSGDDGLVDTSVVLFPAWPCEWDASAQALNTSVPRTPSTPH